MITPTYANVELADDIVHNDVRIIFADRLAWERTAKARGWDASTQPMTAAGYLAWAALHRQKLFNQDYNTFLEQVVDVQLDDTRAGQETDAETDPSLTGH